MMTTILSMIRDRAHLYRAQHGEDPTVLLLTTERYDELNETAAFQAMRLFGQPHGSTSLRFGDMNVFIAHPANDQYVDLLEQGGVEVWGDASAQLMMAQLKAERTV